MPATIKLRTGDEGITYVPPVKPPPTVKPPPPPPAVQPAPPPPPQPPPPAQPKPPPAPPRQTDESDVLVPKGVIPRASAPAQTELAPAPAKPVVQQQPPPPPPTTLPPPVTDLGGDVLVPPNTIIRASAPGETEITPTPSVPVEAPPTQAKPQAPNEPGGIGPWADEDDEPSEQLAYDIDGDFPDLDGLQLFSYDVLSGTRFVNYVRSGCQKRDLDDLAVFANAYNEGIGGGIGDNGSSYGPWQLHDGGALPKRYWNRKRNDPAVNTWAWSTAGVDYALDVMAHTQARGETGDKAVHDLVFYFEQPANKQQQYIIRLDTYYALKGAKDSAYTLLANAAKGPKTTAQAPTQPVAVPQQSSGVVSNWRGLMQLLSGRLPKIGSELTSTSKQMTKAVK